MAERQLRYPSCDGPMQTVERRGVVVDICRECRGVFLDRGELDKLLEAADEMESSAAQDAPRRDEDYEQWRHRHDRGRRRTRTSRVAPWSTTVSRIGAMTLLLAFPGSSAARQRC
jgi:Zn-finger nucleic acid-binding protein